MFRAVAPFLHDISSHPPWISFTPPPMTQISVVNASLAAVASELLLYGIYLALSFFYTLLIFQRQRAFTGASKALRIMSPVFIAMSGLWLAVTGVSFEYHCHCVQVNSAAALHRQRRPPVPRSPAHRSQCQPVLFRLFPHNRTHQVRLLHSLRPYASAMVFWFVHSDQMRTKLMT
jgi:hypothetical protein